jgi:uncharacterized protein
MTKRFFACANVLLLLVFSSSFQFQAVDASKWKETIFLKAIYVNDFSTVDMFIQEGGDVNVVNDDGLTALHISAMHGFYGILSRLLAAGANVHKLTEQHDMTALVLASMKGNLECIEALLAAGSNVNFASPGGSAMQFALVGKHWEAVISLLLAGAGDGRCRNNYPLIFQRSVQNGFEEVAKVLLDKGLVDVNVRLEGGETIMVHAVLRNDSSLVRHLIQRGGDVNAAGVKDGVTPLHVAARSNFVDIIELLLDAGAMVSAADRNAITALRWSVMNNHVEAATILLLANATIEAGEEGEATHDTLHWIASKNFVELARLFLQLSPRIDVNRQRVGNGMTALHIACMNNFHEMAAALIENGALVGIRDASGLTPLQYAVKHEFNDFVDLLLQSVAGLDSDDGQSGGVNRDGDGDEAADDSARASGVHIGDPNMLHNLSDVMVMM